MGRGRHIQTLSGSAVPVNPQPPVFNLVELVWSGAGSVCQRSDSNMSLSFVLHRDEAPPSYHQVRRSDRRADPLHQGTHRSTNTAAPQISTYTPSLELCAFNPNSPLMLLQFFAPRGAEAPPTEGGGPGTALCRQTVRPEQDVMQLLILQRPQRLLFFLRLVSVISFVSEEIPRCAICVDISVQLSCGRRLLDRLLGLFF